MSGILKKGACVSALSICLSARRGGDVRAAALLPIHAQTAGPELQAGLNWAGQSAGGQDWGEKTLWGFGSALIWVIITTGMHTHTHTVALVFVSGVSPDSRAPPPPRPWSEVITWLSVQHGAAISRWMQHNGSFITL